MKYPNLKQFVFKVHGGTTEEDIIMKVQEAEKLAILNRRKKILVDTVLFFDEANTTEAIELMKEIMCDRRIYGRKICDSVKFIAACNPYRMWEFMIIIVIIVLLYNLKLFSGMTRK